MDTKKNQSYRDFLKGKITSLTEQKTKLDEQFKGVELALKLYNEYEAPEPEGEANKQVTSFTPPPEAYSPTFVQAQKAFFALRSLGGKGFTPEVAKELLRLEPELGENRAGDIARQYLSYLNKDLGVITFEKYGRKHKYIIKAPEGA